MTTAIADAPALAQGPRVKPAAHWHDRLALGLLLLAFAIGGWAQSRGMAGRERKVAGGRPVQGETPAADEPTPDRSSTADDREIRAAREHTPPA